MLHEDVLFIGKNTGRAYQCSLDAVTQLIKRKRIFKKFQEEIVGASLLRALLYWLDAWACWMSQWMTLILWKAWTFLMHMVLKFVSTEAFKYPREHCLIQWLFRSILIPSPSGLQGTTVGTVKWSDKTQLRPTYRTRYIILPFYTPLARPYIASIQQRHE